MTSAVALYTQSVTCVCNGTAADASHIGYLDENKTKLQVKGTITQQASTDYFTFSFRKGDSLKLSATINTGVRIQFYDASGSRLLADSSGMNVDMRENFFKLQNGLLDLKNKTYMLKVSYDSGVSKSKDLTYSISVTSGMTYGTLYKTIAYADTIMNEVYNGTYGGSTALTMASFIDGSEETTNIFDFFA